MKVFVFGMGYSSQAAARAMSKGVPDLEIHGTTRSAEKIDELSRQSIQGHVFDGVSKSTSIDQNIGQVTHLVQSISPTDQGDAVLKLYENDLAASKKLTWLCYFSTVGVYGDFDGRWVDERATCLPVNPRSQWRVEVEQSWRNFAARQNLPLAIFRLAGIYGPGRSTFDKIRKGTSRRIIKPGQVFNRIHVEDIGHITALAAAQKLNGTFNLADDEPAPPQHVITHAAKMMSVEPPAEQFFETADMTPMARSFYSDNKRVANAAIKKALGIELLHPTYREGLEMIMRAQ